MPRVFTITPGLENMGGLKTGGQGSIYKGRRIGEIITAVKILPTPVFSESAEDKNFVAFQSEVEKLRKVNEIPNPNVVKILSSGISEAGNFPYIEMEYVEGPDLVELLQSPGHSVFTLTETIRVADQLSNAIAHCHNVDVKHGDIKSNNIKYNVNTGNYLLLDFGLAVLSDEQRRSSIRQSGTIEFMAPEQNSGQLLFQSDVYSFGIVLFELLTGTVPFPLKDKGETARNEVRLAHMASPVPDLLQLRQQALPASWDDQKKEREMQVPQWLVNTINTCLEKKPEKRFSNGKELHNYISQQLTSISANTTSIRNNLSVRPMQKGDMVSYQEQLRKQLLQYRQHLLKKEAELIKLKELLREKDQGLQQGKLVKTDQGKIGNDRVSTASFTILLVFAVAIAAFAIYPVLKNTFASPQTTAIITKDGSRKDELKTEKKPVPARVENQAGDFPSEAGQQETGTTFPEDSAQQNESEQMKKDARETAQKTVEVGENEQEDKNQESEEKPDGHVGENENNAKDKAVPGNPSPQDGNAETNAISKKYLVVSKAYFYNEPEESARRNEFISPLEKAVVQALNERYGFIYVVITNPQGQVFKGWLRKKELKLYSIE